MQDKVSKKSKVLILPCAVIKQEIRQFQNSQVECKLFDYGLHRTSERMAAALQGEIDEANDKDYDAIVLGYGLCGNGIVGVRSRKQRLVVPRVHDCITLFLGSLESYQAQSTQHPGTYYLTQGWIEKGQTPFSKFQSYKESYGEETARWVLHEEMKYHTRIAFIDTGVVPVEPYRKIARQNAEFLRIDYQELPESAALFRSMVQGPWGKDFLVLESCQAIQQEMFLDQ